MKKIIITLCLSIPAFVFAQRDTLIEVKKGADTLITASGFRVVAGDKLKIGVGSMPDGDFKYIRKNATSLFAYSSTRGYQGLANQANSLPRSSSGMEFEVLRIDKRGDKKHGYVYYPVLKGLTRYEVDITNAIASAEVVVPEEFRPKPKALLVELKQPALSIADELIKLKKLKDDGILTEEEFQAQKKKLLEKKDN